MTKRERGQIIRERFFAKGGRVPVLAPRKAKESLRGWLRLWSDQVFSEPSTKAMEWVYRPNPELPLLPERNRRTRSALTAIAERWDERKTLASPTNRNSI